MKPILCLLCFLMFLTNPGFSSASAPIKADLQLIDPASREVVLSLPLRADETFTIRYIHSIDHTPVFEVFELDPDGGLALQATYFQMFGAGMAHWQGHGVLDSDGQWTWIRDIHQRLGSFLLRVGSPGVDHTILYREQAVNLSEKWAGRRLLVTAVERPVPPQVVQHQ